MTESLLFQFPKIGEGPGQKTWIQIQNEPVKELKKLSLNLSASRRIRDDNGLTFLSISGNQQGGKSTYGMAILSELFEGDEDEILRHVVMSAKDFADMVYGALIGGYREKCIMWDDMSLGGRASLWVTDPKLVQALGALGDTLAVATKSIIFSSPSGDMVKAFRNYQKYTVQIHNGQHKWDRVAKGYKMGKSPLGSDWATLIFEDYFDPRLPFYERYALKRKEISLKAVMEMRSFFTKTQPKEEQKPVVSIKERVLELKRDLDAGVFGDMTFKALCKSHKINYGTAKNYI